MRLKDSSRQSDSGVKKRAVSVSGRALSVKKRALSVSKRAALVRKRPQGWSPLKSGDTVDIIAPGFACTPEVLRDALHFLATWELEPRVPHKIFAADVVCSNNDEARMHHLREALLSEDSRAVWCIRGGYGSNRLVPELAKLKKPKGPPKLFIGLSDITTLHVFLNQKWGWPTIHGPLLDRFARGLVKRSYAREMRRLILGETKNIEFKNLKPMNVPARSSGIVRGAVSGGNLITLQSSIGTKAEWDTKGRILFFEDIGERGYRVDRVLEQFRQLGWFDKAQAVVFGDFTGGKEEDGSTRVPGVLKRFAESVEIPVFSGVQSGHDVIQRPVPFETEAELYLGERGRLVCASGAET